MKTKITKKTLLIGLFVMIVLLTGCVATVENEIAEEDYLNLITLEEVVAKVDNGETFNFVLGNDSCPACVYYKEELIKFHKEEDYKFDYMEYNSNTNKELLYELITEKFGEESEQLATPTTFFIVNGELKDKVVGAIEAEKIKAYSGYYK